MKDGLGAMAWPNGQKYDGGWKAGKMDGEGVWRWSNGTCRAGEWVNDKRILWTSAETFGMSGPYAKRCVGLLEGGGGD